MNERELVKLLWYDVRIPIRLDLHWLIHAAHWSARMNQSYWQLPKDKMPLD